MSKHPRIAALFAATIGAVALVGCAAPTAATPSVDLGSASTLPATPQPGASYTPVPDGGRPAGSAATADGEYDVSAGPAGTARFAVSGGGVQLLSVTPAEGWQQAGERLEFDEVELRFSGPGEFVVLDAEFDDRRFKTDVDIDSAATPGQRTYDAAGAGSVTVDVIGDRVALVGQATAPGWVTTVDEQDLAEGDVEVRFRNDGEARTVDVEVDVDRNGGLNVDIDSRTGGDYAAPPAR